jgi:hypothetical protein
MEILHHYTLNTNHTRQSPRAEVADDIIKMLAPTTAPGRHKLPGSFADYECQTSIDPEGGALFTIYAPKRVVATFGVARSEWAAETLWPKIEKLYLKIGDLPGVRSADFAAPHRPERTPWCAVIVIACALEETQWVGDFERCLAWAFLDNPALEL